MRLIDADALREQLVWCKEQAGRFDTFWDDVIERVDSLPTVGLLRGANPIPWKDLDELPDRGAEEGGEVDEHEEVKSEERREKRKERNGGSGA